MTDTPVNQIRTIYQHAIKRVHAGNATREALTLTGDATLRVVDLIAPVPREGVFVIGVGKASVAMTTAVFDRLGGLIRQAIAVTKDEIDPGFESLNVLRGSHPVPDTRSIDAGDAVLEFAAAVPDGGLVLCLISGGGSALVESLRDGVTLEQLRDVTQALLRAGASIHELNAVRSRLSRLKAGGLLHVLRDVQVVNLIVSDVLGDDLHTIASGPTVQPDIGGLTAESVLETYGIDVTLPPVTGAPNRSGHDVRTVVVANVSSAIDAAAEAAGDLGYHPLVLSRTVDGESREVGRFVASIVRDTAAGRTGIQPPVCLLLGGETVVTIRGDGIGGRNTEAALATAIGLRGVEGVAAGFLATDGDDGISGAAGAIVTGNTVDADCLQDARQALQENDSFTFLDRRGAVWVTGPSGTNVNDLVIALVGDVGQ